MSNFTGDGGDNSITGTAGNDSIDISQGGEDTVLAGAGDDSISVGAALDAGDHIDGGDGIGDQLFLNGDYDLVFTDTTVTGVETFQLGSGHDYDLTLADGTATIQGTNSLWIYTTGLLATDHVRIDTTAVQAGHSVLIATVQAVIDVVGGEGGDIILGTNSGRISFDGGGGDDTVNIGRLLDRHDRVNGGAGTGDGLAMGGGGIEDFTGKMLKNVEFITLFAGGDYSLTMADANLGFGKTMTVTANQLEAGQHLGFDGSAERSGSYHVFGGLESDSIMGGRGSDVLGGQVGDDLLIGGRGGDTLTGSFGADTFAYVSLADSGHHKQFDLISDLDSSDHIDLSALDARADKDGDQAFRIVSALDGHAGELAVFFIAEQNLTVAQGDVNGDGKADIAFQMTGDQTGFTGWVL